MSQPPQDGTVVEVREIPEGLLIEVVGDLAMSGTHVLESRVTGILARKARLVVVDLSTTQLVTSLAMGVLVSLNRGVRGYGGAMQLVVTTERVKDALKRVGLDRTFAVSGSLEEAITAAQGVK